MLCSNDPPLDQFWSCIRCNLEYKNHLFTQSKTKENTAFFPLPLPQKVYVYTFLLKGKYIALKEKISKLGLRKDSN